MMKKLEPHFSYAHAPPQLCALSGFLLFVVFASETVALLFLTGVSLSLLNMLVVQRYINVALDENLKEFQNMSVKKILALICRLNTEENVFSCILDIVSLF